MDRAAWAGAVNFARDLVDAADLGRLALVELDRDGRRRTWSFGDLAAGARGFAAAWSATASRAATSSSRSWATVRSGCWRWSRASASAPWSSVHGAAPHGISACASRPHAPRRSSATRPNRAELDAAGPRCRVLAVPDDALLRAADAPPPPAEMSPEDPCLIAFTSGTCGEPRAVVHAQRYLAGQRVQAEHWLDARPGDVVSCTAGSGWSKSARNVFIAPWIRGAAALLHDARLDPHERVEVIAREPVAVLCMASTEYRVIAKRASPRRRGRRRLPALRGPHRRPHRLGAVVRAVVVLRDGVAPSERLTRDLQDHVKARTAPYKYPRVVDFAAELPKTPSGKIRRALLRGDGQPA